MLMEAFDFRYDTPFPMVYNKCLFLEFVAAKLHGLL